MTILPYDPHPAQYLESDPSCSVVAQTLVAAIQNADPDLAVEHVGSTSVPGCAGKGIIDLAVLYRPGALAEARRALDRIGFQVQIGKDPFPESRPMRVGAVRVDGRTYRIHAHVLERDGREHGELVWFRDRLRADAALLADYQGAKQDILGAGISDSYDYAVAKSRFVAAELRRWIGRLPAGGAGTVTIGGSLVVNRVGYGTMRLTGPGIWGEPADRDVARAVLRRALTLGVNLFDTADYYGPEVANRLVFEALHPYRDDVVIATKVGFRRGPDRSWLPDHAPDRIRIAVHDNLRHLGRERMDLVHFRFADDGPVPAGDSIGALVDLVREGKVGHIGVSNATMAQLAEAERVTPIATVSNVYHAGNRGAEPILEWCAARGVPFLPYFPLGGGALTRPDGPLARLGQELGATAGQLALGWLLARSPVIAPIPGTGSLGHLEANVATGALRLGPDQLAAILRAASAA